MLNIKMPAGALAILTPTALCVGIWGHQMDFKPSDATQDSVRSGAPPDVPPGDASPPEETEHSVRSEATPAEYSDWVPFAAQRAQV